MTPTPRYRISPRMQRGLALKAFAYGGLSAGCFPIAGMVARPELKPMLAAFGLAFSLASLLAIFIFRRSLTQEQRTPRMSTTLGAGATAVICLAIAQLVIIGMQIYAQIR
jgi:hypothetical protein